MRNTVRTSILSILAAPVVIAAGVGLLLAACGSSSRDGFQPDGNLANPENDSGAPQTCATAEAMAIKPPVDFIFVVDQSGSMRDELVRVQGTINLLPELLQKTHLDYRVVMIAGKNIPDNPPNFDFNNSVCVPEPLAGPDCSSNGTIFRLVDQRVESNDVLKLTIETLTATSGPTAWRDFVREDSLKVFMPITDDQPTAAYNGCISGADAGALKCDGAFFDQQLLAIGGTPFGSATKRKYVAFPVIGSEAAPAEENCSTQVYSFGPQYIQLAKLTGGTWFPVCQVDFHAIFKEVNKRANAAVTCEVSIPSVEGTDIDPNRLNVKVTKPDGTIIEVLKDTTDCNNGADGWQYSADGKKIILCGQTCETVKEDPEDKITVEFGCLTKVK
jgi:hypothetical protein